MRAGAQGDVRASVVKRLVEGAAVFAVALLFLLLLAPNAPFSKELGVCEAPAVRDVLAGHVILPDFAPGVMSHVPPLYWWAAAVSVRLFGWTEFALRLPALAAGALCAAVVFGWLAATAGYPAALLGTAALLACHFFADAARQPRMDTMLAMFVAAAAICLERSLAPGGRGGNWLLAAALAMGAATLAKGPLGILLPGLAVALYLMLQSRAKELFRPGLLGAFALGAAISGAWYLAAYQVGGARFVQWQIKAGLLRRFLPSGMGGAGFCAHPFYYFVPHLLTGFLPFSLYLPALAIWLWRRRAALAAPAEFAFCWFVSTFVFFSLSAGKCLVYIVPAFAPLAALVGWLLAGLEAESAGERLALGAFRAGSLAIAVGTLAMAGGGGALAFVNLPETLPVRIHPTDLRLLGIFEAMAARRAPAFLLWFAGSTAGALVALGGALKSRLRMQSLGAVLVAGAGTLFWFGAMSPKLAAETSLKSFASEVNRVVGKAAEIDYLGLADCDFVFYAARPVREVRDVECGAQGATRFIVMTETRLVQLPSSVGACLRPLAISAAVDRQGARILMERTTRAAGAR